MKFDPTEFDSLAVRRRQKQLVEEPGLMTYHSRLIIRLSGNKMKPRCSTPPL